MDVTQISKVYAQLDPPLWLVTAADGGRRGGLIATTVTQASIVAEMPRQLITIAQRNNTHALIEASSAFAMHLIDETQLELVWRFGLQSGRDVDKLAGLQLTYRSDRKPALARGVGLVRLPGGSPHGLGRPHRLPGRSRRWPTATNRSATDKPPFLCYRPSG